jgi:hypothetical protein
VRLVVKSKSWLQVKMRERNNVHGKLSIALLIAVLSASLGFADSASAAKN